MKQLRVLLLLLLFLQSKIGLAFNVHYCGAHIAKISWAFDAKGCGMEKQVPASDVLQFSQESCCDDDLIIAQNDGDQNINDQEQLFVDPFPETFLSLIHVPNFDQIIKQHTGFHPPPTATLYLKHCALIFYD